MIYSSSAATPILKSVCLGTFISNSKVEFMFVKIAITCHGDPRDIGRHKGPNSSSYMNRFYFRDDHESKSISESWADVTFILQSAWAGGKATKFKSSLKNTQ